MNVLKILTSVLFVLAFFFISPNKIFKNTPYAEYNSGFFEKNQLLVFQVVDPQLNFDQRQSVAMEQVKASKVISNAEIPSTVSIQRGFHYDLVEISEGKFQVQKSSFEKDQTSVRREGRMQTTMTQTAGVELIPFLKEHSDDRILLRILSNNEDMHQRLSQLIANAKIPDFEKHFLFYGPYQNVILSLKDLQPSWMFGSSFVDAIRWNIWKGFFLLPVASLKSDVWISPLQLKKRSLIDSEIMTELHRRYKKVILGPLESQDDWKSLGELPEGIILLD